MPEVKNLIHTEEKKKDSLLLRILKKRKKKPPKKDHQLRHSMALAGRFVKENP